jgi:hypothetical protein
MKELGVPVLQPGNVAVKFAELLHDLKLTHSRKAYPLGSEHYVKLMDMFRESVHRARAV